MFLMILVLAKLICNPRTLNCGLFLIIFIHLTSNDILVLMLGIFDEKDLYRRLSLLHISNCSNDTLLARMPEKRARAEFPLGFGCIKTTN